MDEAGKMEHQGMDVPRNKHFDQHKKLMNHQNPQTIFEYISKHQELFQFMT